jgi:ribosome-binding protein aMBF1 (putative translation factor)
VKLKVDHWSMTRQHKSSLLLIVDERRPMVYQLSVKRKPRRRKMGRTKARRRLEGPIHACIAKLRVANKLTQKALADILDVDKTAVSHWEMGISRPDQSRLPAVAKALGVSVDELLNGEKAAG